MNAKIIVFIVVALLAISPSLALLNAGAVQGGLGRGVVAPIQASQPPAAPMCVVCGEIISQSGDYAICQDLTATTAPCIGITADGVNLDGQGYTISSSVNTLDGIRIEASNVLVENVTILQTQFGIAGYTASDITLEDIVVAAPSVAGVYFSIAQNLDFDTVAVVGTGLGVGLLLDETINSQFLNNYFTQTSEAIRLTGNSYGNDFVNSFFASNTQGINDQTSQGATNFITYSNEFGRINWGGASGLADISLPGSVSFSSSPVTQITIGQNVASIDTVLVPQLNIPAEVRLFNTPTDLVDPAIVYNEDQLCSTCTIINPINSGNAAFTVSGFSSYSIQEAATVTCGNAVIDGAETCDDGNNVGGDGCSSLCQLEPGCFIEDVSLWNVQNAQPASCSASVTFNNFNDLTLTQSQCILASSIALENTRSYADDFQARLQLSDVTVTPPDGRDTVIAGIHIDGELPNGTKHRIVYERTWTTPDGAGVRAAHIRDVDAFSLAEASNLDTSAFVVETSWVWGLRTGQELLMWVDRNRVSSSRDTFTTGSFWNGPSPFIEEFTIDGGLQDVTVRIVSTHEQTGTTQGPGTQTDLQYRYTNVDGGQNVVCEPRCGDGIAFNSPGEQCDDNNLLDGDGCSSTCVVEYAICGNGIVEPNGRDGLPGTFDDEQCDDANTDNTDGCVIDPSNDIFCKQSICGDGHIQPINSQGQVEVCDAGANNGLPGSFCTATCEFADVGVPRFVEDIQCEINTNGNWQACNQANFDDVIIGARTQCFSFDPANLANSARIEVRNNANQYTQQLTAALNGDWLEGQFAQPIAVTSSGTWEIEAECGQTVQRQCDVIIPTTKSSWVVPFGEYFTYTETYEVTEACCDYGQSTAVQKDTTQTLRPDDYLVRNYVNQDESFYTNNMTCQWVADVTQCTGERTVVLGQDLTGGGISPFESGASQHLCCAPKLSLTMNTAGCPDGYAMFATFQDPVNGGPIFNELNNQFPVGLCAAPLNASQDLSCSLEPAGTDRFGEPIVCPTGNCVYAITDLGLIRDCGANDAIFQQCCQRGAS